tara:strand:- start:19909 stop:20376 length:468 start_codon:yes stop_codon:yes gene_type:complete
MKLMKTLQKFMKANSVISLVAVVVVGYLLYNYSTKFTGSMDRFNVGNAVKSAEDAVVAAASSVESAVKSVGGSDDAPVQNNETVSPSQLLPQGESVNMAFEQLQPVHTVRHRNANLQLRSEPANPKMDVGPWNQSTDSADPYRRPLEIGGACGEM